MLRLVHPRHEGKDPRVSKGQKSPALTPTTDERARIQAAIKNLARAYGGYDVLSAVTGIPNKTLHHAHKITSYAVALRVAQAAQMPVETLLSGRPVAAGVCPLCHRKGGAS